MLKKQNSVFIDEIYKNCNQNGFDDEIVERTLKKQIELGIFMETNNAITFSVY